jgi:hypothetical protein
MTEEFLHYLWKFRLYDPQHLFTADGESIEVIKPGTHNHHAGPDFENAVIKIGDTKWAGNVEIHIKSSDWYNHSHQHDNSYNNVILHVVYENDKVVKQNEITIPTLELKSKIPALVFEKYSSLIANKNWIACDSQVKQVDDIILKNWLSRLTIQRLEKKANSIKEALSLNNNNWQEVFYRQLVRNFGFQLNALPFELLSKSLPLSYLLKHRYSSLQVEAMLFGQAGMLEKEFVDDYPKQLQKEYRFLKQKFNLQAIDPHLWKFLRLRPVSFPTIRLSQLSHLIQKSEFLFSKIFESKTLKDFQNLFDAKTSDYWESHYVFDKTAAFREKPLGKTSINTILINTVAPFIFVYGEQKQDEIVKEKSLNLLEVIPAETNSIIDNWKTHGIIPANSFDSQALIELKNNFCIYKRCLECSIGTHILKRKAND